jgi:ATP-binding cassette subfamily F protein uup
VKAADPGASRAGAPPADAAAAPRRRKLSFKEQQELAALPGLIETLETEMASLHAAMGAADYFRQSGDILARDKTRLDDLQTRLDAAFVRWETLEEPA